MPSIRWKHPALFLSRAENRDLQERIGQFERATDCELVLNFCRKFKHPDPLAANRELFFKHRLDRTERRTAILLTLALHTRQLAIWADEGVVKRSDDSLFQTVIQLISQKLKEGERLGALIAGIDAMERVLSVMQPAFVRNPNEISNKPIVED